MSKIGIFGGSFNPTHITHIEIAKAFINQLNLDKCLLIPTYISPFKINNKENNFFTNQQRLDMLYLAIENLPKFEVIDYEITKQKVSYTFETIDYLKKIFKNDRLYLLIGSDQAINFKKWKKWKYIVKNVHLCIVERANVEIDLKTVIKELSYNDMEPILIDFPKNNISSTKIREMIRANKNLKGLVPQNVEQYIYKVFNY